MSTHALRAAAGGETEAQDSATLEILLKALMAGLATILTARIGAIAAVAAAVAATLATEGVHQLARRRNWGVKRVGLLVAATVALGSIDSKLARGARRLFGEGSRVVDAVAQGAGHVVLTTTAATALTVSAVTVPELATGESILADRPSTFFSARETDREAPDLERTFEITLGRVGRLAFDAERGDRVFVELTDATTGTTTLTLQAPDGSSLASTYAYPHLDTTRLPDAGTYTVTVDPWDNNTGTATVRVVRVPADPTATVELSETPKSATFRITTGQNAELRFQATAGDRVFVELTETTTATTTLTLQAPDGSSLASTYAYPYLDTTRLPATGTYTVTVDPWDNNSGSVTLRIVRVV